MKTRSHSVRRVTALGLAAFAFVLLLAPSASAQVGYDPSQKLEVLGSAISNCETGEVAADFTLPDDVEPGYQVIATGVDPNDVRRDVLANVTPVGTSSDGSLVRTIHVTADGFKPCTTVKFSVRFPFPNAGPVVEGAPLPLTGSQTGFLVAVASAAILIGIALVQGARARARHVS